MTAHAGCFVVIEGPSGVGKTTVTALLCGELARRGIPVLATREPTGSPLGDLARRGTREYGGTALACLVAADRYHHIDQGIRPALAAGRTVVCDRYVPSSLVLQRMDGVAPEFIEHLNQYAPQPDLTVILTGEPARSGERAGKRGLYSRFHDGGHAIRAEEARLYQDVAEHLARAGHTVLRHEVDRQPASAVTAAVLAAVLPLLGPSG